MVNTPPCSSGCNFPKNITKTFSKTASNNVSYKNYTAVHRLYFLLQPPKPQHCGCLSVHRYVDKLVRYPINTNVYIQTWYISIKDLSY